MKNIMKDKLIEIINHFGPENQRKKLMEEMLELQDELFKWYELDGLNENCDNLLGEIADVLCLVLQFAYEFGFTDEEIQNKMIFKIDRTLERIKEKYYEK